MRQRAYITQHHFVNGRPLAGPYPEGSQRAVFAMGCFWGAERLFWEAQGVWVTAAGYCGGKRPNPTYEQVCTGLTGHAESVLVVFDPKETSFEQLLELFWENHDPTQGMRQGNDVGPQYRSAVFWTTEAQEEVALASREAYEDLLAKAGYRRVLVRRGLPPAVPGQEPGRLLRAGGHGGQADRPL
jgi:peptide-methionine (S)-S-oxide reductase